MLSRTRTTRNTDSATFINIQPTRITTQFPDSQGKVSKTEITYDSDATFDFYDLWLESTTAYPLTFGTVRDESVYDYSTGTAGLKVRETVNTYRRNVDANYWNANLLDLADSTVIKDGNGNRVAEMDYSYDDSNRLFASGITTQHTTPPNAVRGNVSSITRWLNTGTSPTTYVDVYDTGMQYHAIDPLAHTTTYSYSSIFAGAYATQIEAPVTGSVHHTSSLNFDWNTGWKTSVTDENSNPTTFAYDALGLTTLINFPDGGQITADANGYAVPVIITKTQVATPSPNIVTAVRYDGLGRPVSSRLLDPEGDVYSDTTYDGVGRVRTVSNPHRTAAGPTDGITTYSYDALRRLTRTDRQDGVNYVTSTYTGNEVVITDETGHQRMSVSDALGRLTRVIEDPGSGHLNYETDYKYDAVGNLLCVEQHGDANGTGCSDDPASDASSPWRVRRFTYDSLSQLLTAKNPESGTISYVYDGDGNLVQKTDARSVNTFFTYDALHRMTQKSYSDPNTAAVGWYYDETSIWGVNPANPIGRLTHNVTSGAAVVYSYDDSGRVADQWTCLPSNCGSSSYRMTAQYDLAGHRTLLSYPSGRTIRDYYNETGLLRNVQFESFSGQPVNIAYWAVPDAGSRPAASFHPTGIPRYERHGDATEETHEFNNRLQPSYVALWGASPTAFSSYYYDYADPGQDNHNNGNIIKINDYVNAGRSQNFRYDNLNRIATAWTTAEEGADAWSQTFEPDPWSNLRQYGARNFSPTYDNANRMTPWTDEGVCYRNTGTYCYDAAGNLTWDLTHAYRYDAEGRIVGVDADATTYLYDADGARVRKQTSSAKTEYVYFGGQVIAEVDPDSGTWTDYVYANGKRVARAMGSTAATTTYYHADHLGSARIETDAGGNLVSNCTFLPFGSQFDCSPDDADNHYKFTGKERDSETGLDYFGARYYGSTMGRWMSPDWSASPEPVPYADFSDPQTLNLYGYVRNNPLSHADADGHCCSAEWNFLKAEVRGVWNATGGGVVALGRSVASGEAGRNIATTANLAVHNPSAIGEAGKQFGSQMVNTVKAAAQGNPEAIGEAVGTVAAVAAPFAKGVLPSKTTTMFRAVDGAEAADISSSGAFTAAPNGTEYKGFFNNASDAQQFGSNMQKLTGDQYSVVSGDVPNSVLKNSPNHTAAGEGPGKLIRNEDLSKIKNVKEQ